MHGAKNIKKWIFISINQVLKKIIRPNRELVTEGWRM